MKCAGAGADFRGDMRNWFFCGTLLLTLAVGGCSQSLMSMFTPTAESKIGQSFFDDIRVGNFGPIRTALDPIYKDQLTPTMLQEIRNFFGERPVKSIKIIGSNTTTSPAATTYSLAYEYELEGRWVVAQIVLRKLDGRLQIEGMHVTPLTVSVEEKNAFTLTGKTPYHLAFLVSSIAIALFTIGTTIVCWRTPIPRRKWIWRIFVLFGISSLTLNWTTGFIQYQILQIVLFGSGFMKPPYGPMMLQISFPVGAIVFWWRRRAWHNAQTVGAIEKLRE
jgi:hypothetical protein